jgi:chemotaxis signal transduction protein
MVQETTGPEEAQRYVLVKTGSLPCALPASDVVRVVRGLVCFPIPGSKPQLLGLAQYGGEPLPVLDLHALVDGNVSGTRHSATVIVGRSRRRDRRILGLAVDEVVRVVDAVDIPSLSAQDPVLDATIEGEEVKVVNTQLLLIDAADDSGAVDG